MDALVFVRNPPDDVGNLTAPPVSVLPMAKRYERVWDNQDVGDHHRTRPVWTFAIDKQGTGRPSPLEHDELFQGQVYEQYAGFRADLLELEREDFETLKRGALEQYRSLQERAARLPGAVTMPRGVEMPPWLNHFFLPPNQRLESTPQPQLNPHFSDEIEKMESEILRAFRVPPMLMETTHATRVAAQPEMAAKQWGTTVRGWQRALASALGETYMFVSADVFAAYSEAVLGRVREQRREAIEQTIKRPRTRRTQEDASAAATTSTDNNNNDNNGETAERPFRNDAGELQMPESDESLRRAAQVICTTDTQVVEHLRAQFGVDVEFKCAPMLTYPELKQFYDDGLLSLDTLAAKAAAVSGMSEKDFLIGDDARLKDARARRKLQETLEPPDQAGAPARGKKRPQ